MKKYIPILFTLICSTLMSQNNLDVIIDEAALNDALKIIKGARAINFGDYKNKHGLNAWYVNLDSATVDIKPNNKVKLTNVVISGGADLQLALFSMTPTGNITGSLEGQLYIGGNSTKGYYLGLKITRQPTLVYSGPLAGIVNLALFLTNNFGLVIPDIEISLGNSLLPGALQKYLKNEIPVITTNDSEIKVSFEVLFDDINLKNKTIKSGESINYTASNTIEFQSGFVAEEGSTLYASIVPKLPQSRSAVTFSDNIILGVGDSIHSDVTGVTYSDNDIVNNENTSLSALNEEQNLLSLPFSLTIWNSVGVIVYKEDNITLNDNIDLSFLQEGVYVANYSSALLKKSKKFILDKDKFFHPFIDE